LIIIRWVVLHVLESDLLKKIIIILDFFSSKHRVSLSGAVDSESETMSNELPAPTTPNTRRRSSTFVIPEGKPTFSQPLESELFINEDVQLT
jgi:hypothetical protein